MGTLSRIGHPSFFTSSLMATSPPTRGAGTGEPQQRLRVDASFHQFRSPFKKRTGVFWRAGRGPEWNAPTRRAAVNSGNSRTGTSSTAISRAELIQHVSDLGRGSRQVVPHLATQPRSLYEC